MVYKILIFEAMAICGMLYFRFEPRLVFGKDANDGMALVDARSSEVDAPAPLPQRVVDEQDLLFPVAGHGPENVISVFGDKRGKSRLHQGIDIKAARGTAVVAVTAGFVERVKNSGSGGKCVYLRDVTGRLFYYAHLDRIGVEEFAAVQAGDPLGTVGDTGNARGTTPHLHFEVLIGKNRRAIDPLPFWAKA